MTDKQPNVARVLDSFLHCRCILAAPDHPGQDTYSCQHAAGVSLASLGAVIPAGSGNILVDIAGGDASDRGSNQHKSSGGVSGCVCWGGLGDGQVPSTINDLQ